jgi:thioredoxin reductase (NADPH)
LIYRKKELRAEKYWRNLAARSEKIKVIYETNVVEIIGEKKVEQVILDREYAGEKSLSVDAVFIEIGAEPELTFAKELELETDAEGYIKIQKTGATTQVGVWAAGDITDGSDKFRQIITAAAEGAVAAKNIALFLQEKK